MKKYVKDLKSNEKNLREIWEIGIAKALKNILEELSKQLEHFDIQITKEYIISPSIREQNFSPLSQMRATLTYKGYAFSCVITLMSDFLKAKFIITNPGFEAQKNQIVTIDEIKNSIFDSNIELHDLTPRIIHDALENCIKKRGKYVSKQTGII